MSALSLVIFTVGPPSLSFGPATLTGFLFGAYDKYNGRAPRPFLSRNNLLFVGASSALSIGSACITFNDIVNYNIKEYRTKDPHGACIWLSVLGSFLLFGNLSYHVSIRGFYFLSKLLK